MDNNSSRTTKRRKRRKVITYQTVRERKRAKYNSSIRRSETVSESVGDLDTITISTNNSSTGSETQKAVGNGRNQRTKSDSSVSMLKTTEAGKVDHVRSNSFATASTQPVSVPESRTLKSLGKRSSKQIGKKSAKDQVSNSPKKRKTSTEANEEPSTSETSMTKTTGTRVKTRPRKSQIIPDRIKDVTVSKKAFSKWKPLSKSTKEFVDQTLKTVIIDVIADINAKENQEAVKCLTKLKDRIMEKLPHLKAPYTQGEYKKMETQNKVSEDALIMKSREINALEKKTEEEQRLLKAESAMVQEYTNKLRLCKKELSSLDNEKAHPLLRKTENVLDLPELPEELFNSDEEEVPLEADSAEEIHLTQTLLKLREKANSVGLTKYVDRLGKLAADLEEQA